MKKMPPASPAPHPAAPQEISRRERTWMFAGAIVVIVAAIYASSLRAPFVFDDVGSIVENPTIRRLSADALSPPRGETVTGRPLVNLSLAFNYACGGTSVTSYRVFNISLHALAALLVMGVVRRTLCSPRLAESFSPRAAWLAFLASLLWAAHPLNSEAVLLVVQRTELLCGVFYLLTLYGLLRATEAGARAAGWLLLSVFSCVLGGLSKEVIATAPILAFLLDRTFLAGSFAEAWRKRRVFYCALASTWIVLGFTAFHARAGSAGLGLGVSPWNYLLRQCEALVTYLKLSVWPHPLVLDYGTAVVTSWTSVVVEGVAVLLLLVGTAWAIVRRPVIGFLGAAFFLILAPSSSVIPVVTETIAEHRMYLPLAVLCAYGVVALQSWLRGIGTVAVLALVGAFAVATHLRVHDYRDPLTLWTHSVAHYPQSARAHNNLALELHLLGRDNEARAQFAEALAIDPLYASAHYNLGTLLLDEQHTAEAIQEFESALRVQPDHADAHLSLGNAFMGQGRFADAARHYAEVLRLQPSALDAKYNLGLALASLGQLADAAPHLEAALGTRPDLFEAAYRLGRYAESLGRLSEAEARYLQTLKAAPEHFGARAALGALLARQSRFAEAETHLREARRLNPHVAEPIANLGNVLLLQGRAAEAIECYEAALEISPNHPGVLRNLEVARNALGKGPFRDIPR